jgi:hypothetical protein
MNRRKFIGLAGGAAAALAGAGVASYALVSAEVPEVPAGGWGGFTPNKDFYVFSYTGTPRAPQSDWKVKIHGLVENPFELDLRRSRRCRRFRRRSPWSASAIRLTAAR